MCVGAALPCSLLQSTTGTEWCVSAAIDREAWVGGWLLIACGSDPPPSRGCGESSVDGISVIVIGGGSLHPSRVPTDLLTGLPAIESARFSGRENFD